MKFYKIKWYLEICHFLRIYPKKFLSLSNMTWSDLIFRVVSYCESRGWQRIYDKTRMDYKLKWCENKSPAAYYSFRAGDLFCYVRFTAIMKKAFYTLSVYFRTGGQLIYQIPNNKVLTTKIGLLNSLREFDRVSSKVNYGRGNRLLMENFTRVT